MERINGISKRRIFTNNENQILNLKIMTESLVSKSLVWGIKIDVDRREK